MSALIVTEQNMMEKIGREKIMQQWDIWRKYIANGGTGSWPRDAFEALLDCLDEQLENKVRERFKHIIGGKGSMIPRIAVKFAINDIFGKSDAESEGE